MSLCRTLSACVIVTSLVSPSNGIIHTSVAFAAQRTSCEIAGQWAGRKGIRLGDEFKVSSLYAFRFGSDGSYSYVVGDEAGTAASHSGTFVTTEAADEGGRRYPCLLTLQPSKSTVRRDLNRNIGSAPKGFESLSDGALTTFRVRQSAGGELLLIHTSVTGRDLENDIGSFRLTRTP